MGEQVVIGSCTDMCPENERKFRIKNKLVSNFELINNKPVENRMIKEYRRSAGQNEIKKNELRTEEGKF